MISNSIDHLERLQMAKATALRQLPNVASCSQTSHSQSSPGPSLPEWLTNEQQAPDLTQSKHTFFSAL